MEPYHDESRGYAPEETGEQGVVTETQLNTALRYIPIIVIRKYLRRGIRSYLS
jgi:hypothetical protein